MTTPLNQQIAMKLARAADLLEQHDAVYLNAGYFISPCISNWRTTMQQPFTSSNLYSHFR